MKLSNQKVLLEALQNSLVDADYFHIQGARTRFSEKRSQIQILGLDSLLLRAYNPVPSSRNEKWIWLQDLLLEGQKNKVTNNEILGLDSLLRQAYNPPPLPRMRNGN